jgi:hypothetical protein
MTQRAAPDIEFMQWALYWGARWSELHLGKVNGPFVSPAMCRTAVDHYVRGVEPWTSADHVHQGTEPVGADGEQARGGDVG